MTHSQVLTALNSVAKDAAKTGSMTYPYITEIERLHTTTGCPFRAEKCLAMVDGKPVTLVNSFPSKERAEDWCTGSIAAEVKARVVPTQISFLNPA